jgi:hypothetical protein
MLSLRLTGFDPKQTSLHRSKQTCAITSSAATSPARALGHIRGHGCRDLLVFCGSIHCNHETKINADHLPD